MVTVLPENLQGRRLSDGVNEADVKHAGFAEADFDFGDIRAWPAQRVEHRDGDALAARVDAGRETFPTCLENFLGQPLRKVVAAHGVFIDVIGHDARSEVVSLVEEHRFPGAPEHRIVGSSRRTEALVSSDARLRISASLLPP